MMRYVLVFAALLVAAVIWQSPSVLVEVGSEPQASAEQPAQPANSTNSEMTINPEKRTGQKARAAAQAEQQAQRFKSLLNKAQQNQQGNIQPWLEKLWRQCSTAEDADCEATLALLAPYLNASQQQWLEQALHNFGQYHGEMTELTLSHDMSAQQRFNVLAQIREKHFEEQTQAVFGLEHSYAQYQFDYDYLKQVEAPQLSVEQRLDALNELQQQAHLGERQDELIGPDRRYQQALSLLEDLPEDEKRQWQEQLRAKYFGDEADAVAAYEQRQQAQRQQQQDYQQALEALQERAEDLGGINSPAYQQELSAIRARLFD